MRDKEAARRRSAQYREKNRVRIAKQKREYYLLNRERFLLKSREHYRLNKVEINKQTASYRRRTRAKVRARARAYYWANRESIRLKTKIRGRSPKAKVQRLKWYRLNHSSIRRKTESKRRRRMKTDIGYRIRCLIRGRIKAALRTAKVKKRYHSLPLLGCTVPDFMRHIEKQWKEGMSWANHGKSWQIDHIRPCCSFDLTEASQQTECFNWSNQQPLTVEEHHVKSAVDRSLCIESV